MALEVRWYDSVCFAIVAGAVVVSLWMIRETTLGGRRRREASSKYESFLIVAALNGSSGEAAELPGPPASERRRVGYDQLWTSCWRGVHPALLLVLRLISMATMAAIFLWDILTYDSTIMMYYTEACDRLGSRGLRPMEFSPSMAEAAAAGEEAAPGYWTRWQTLVCALVVFAPAAAAVAVAASAMAQPLIAVDLWAPCWAGVHPAWLLAYRGLVFLAMAWLLFQMVVFRGLAAFYFYTQWTFALVIVYFAIATIISAHGCWLYSKRNIAQDEEAYSFLNGGVEHTTSVNAPFRTNKNLNAIRLQSYHEQEADGKMAGFWGYAMQVVYQASAGAVMLTDFVFWVLLVPFLSSEHFGLNAILGTLGSNWFCSTAFVVGLSFLTLPITSSLGWNMVFTFSLLPFGTSEIMGCMHSLNAVFLLLDTLLNNLPFPWFRMAYFILWSCIYVTFQWILHACGFSWWPYPFLELDTPWAPLWYFCMALIHVPCYGLYWLIVRAKNSYFPKYFPNDFIRTY